MANEEEVWVLFGGDSGERRVSVASAQHVAERFPEAKLLFWNDGRDLIGVSRSELLAFERPFEGDFTVRAPTLRYDALPQALSEAKKASAALLLALHGGAGEDGTLQGKLEDAGVAFTGSGSVASRRAFDKSMARSYVRASGGAVAEAVTLPPDDVIAAKAAIEDLVTRFGRAVVKPIADGSSVGLFHARSVDDAIVIARAAQERRVGYIAEAFVSGPELTIGVVQTPSGSRALVASEVRLAEGRTFDFEGKYLGKGTVELTPAQQPAAQVAAAQALAVLAHDALGCEGYSRTDVILGDNGPVFLETNTLPGLTRASFIPQQLAEEKIEMRDFLMSQIALGRARARLTGRARARQ